MDKTTTLTAALTDLAVPLAASLGLSVWGIDCAFGPRSLIRVYVEGPDGVDIEKCAELSRLLGLTLDVEDLVADAYVLEVSSPGLERVFFTGQQLAAHVGRTVEVTLHEPLAAYPGRRKMIGVLTDEKNGVFTLLPLDAPGPGLDPVSVNFAWNDAKKVKLVHFLPETPAAKKGVKPGRRPAKKTGTKKTDPDPQHAE